MFTYKEFSVVKSKCRPEGTQIRETDNSFLQVLLSHTGARIVEEQKIVIEEEVNGDNNKHIKTQLIISYGFDGSQAQYKQIDTNHVKRF